MLVGELTPVSHLVKLEVTSGAAASHACDIASLRVGEQRSEIPQSSSIIGVIIRGN